MAGWTGLEPATSCVTGRCSNQIELPPQFYFLRRIDMGIITQYPIVRIIGAIFVD